MRILSIICVTASIIIICFSIIKFKNLISICKMETYQKYTKLNIYSACLSLMYFFLFGYIFVVTVMALNNDIQEELMVSSVIFLFESVFVLLMILVQESMNILLSSKTFELMKTLINAIEMKDSYTKGHSQHVYDIIELFYEKLPAIYKKNINKPKLLDAALLHDIGKIGIPDSILNKPGMLEDWERKLIQSHAKNGKKILDDTSFHEISEWVCYHHEKIDGNGYYNVPKEVIPLESRIIAIADIYSALSSDRVYRKKFSHEDSIEILKKSSGTELDPELVRCFCEISKEELEKIAL